MVHTLPDYTTKYKMTKVFANIDSAELAARLGSIDKFDRRGSVMALSDFETTLAQWTPRGSGVGNNVYINASEARTGIASCKMITGAAAGENADIYRYLPYYDKSKLGYELSFTLDDNVRELDFIMYLYDGTNRHDCIVKYYPQVNDLRATTGDAGILTVDSDLDLLAKNKFFHTFKATANFETGMFGEIIVDNHHYDMSTHTLPVGLGGPGPCLYYFFSVITNVNLNVSIFVDDFIATSDEP